MLYNLGIKYFSSVLIKQLFYLKKHDFFFFFMTYPLDYLFCLFDFLFIYSEAAYHY